MTNLVNAFPAVGIEPVLVTAGGDGAALDRVARPGIVRQLGDGHALRTIAKLRRLIRSLAPDVVLSTTETGNFIAAAAVSLAGGAPPVVLHENDGGEARDEPGFVRRRMAHWVLRRASAVVVTSRGLRRELARDYRLVWERTVILPNPVEVSAIAQAAREARAGTSPAPGGPLLVAIGRLTRRKGFDILLDTFARLRTEGVRLAILGDGPDRGLLEQRARRLGVAGRVLLPGLVATPYDWLAHADVFVLSSRREGFGQGIVEAMAAGVPVIATDCPHGPADLIDHGKNGILVPLGEDLEDRLRDQIDGLLASPKRCRALRDVAAIAAGEFESKLVADRYADLFRRVITQKREADIIDGRTR